MHVLQKMKFKSLESRVEELRSAREGGHGDPLREAAALIEWAEFYEKNEYDSDLPHASEKIREYYRAAAILGNMEACYRVGKKFLELGRFWTEFSKGGYGDSVHEKYAQGAYEEAFIFLKKAEEQSHYLAMRLHGLAVINGWGVESDPDKGFERVVQSINVEGAWDRATQIFQEYGLNSPRFFNALLTLKKADNK